MLVLISDIHLTDHPAGDIRLEQVLIDFLKRIEKTARSLRTFQRLDIILLGDIFDILKSRRWQDSRIRPWDEHTDVLGELVFSIVSEILNRFRKLANFIQTLQSSLGSAFRIEYLLGNHDYLLNSKFCSRARKLLRRRLCLMGESDAQFRMHVFKPQYGIVAMHGHQFDPWNNIQGELWPFGDAIVIELVQGFLDYVEKNLTLRKTKSIFRELNDIYYVHPDSLLPLWVSALIRKHGFDEDHIQIIAEGWEAAVDRLWEIDFFAKRIEQYRKIPGFSLKEQVLKKTKTLFTKIPELPESIIRLLKREESLSHYERWACLRLNAHSVVQNNQEASFIVMGHTHRPGIYHLNSSPRRIRTYINTGTWRHVHVPAIFGNEKYLNFSTEFVTSYVVFYDNREAKETGRRYDFHQITSSYI